MSSRIKMMDGAIAKWDPASYQKLKGLVRQRMDQYRKEGVKEPGNKVIQDATLKRDINGTFTSTYLVAKVVGDIKKDENAQLENLIRATQFLPPLPKNE